MNTNNKKNPVGRPKTPDYRKKNLRYSKVEDLFLRHLKHFENENDRQLVLSVLEKLRK